MTFGGMLALCLATSAGAQRVHNVVIETPNARLELIGLKRWTLAMVQDSLARYAPNDSLVSHACAAILREKLGFADAAVQYHPPGFHGNAKGYFAVPVVEPQDSARVRYRPLQRDSVPEPARWAGALAVFKNHNDVFQSAIQRPAFLLATAHPESLEARLVLARPLLELLRAQYTEADRQLALRTLAHDRNTEHRALAAVLLARFAASDATWWALADALRDQAGMVSATASQVLNTLASSSPRTVEWAPAADGLRAVLDGTSLFTHNTLLATLAATRVSPSLAADLLRGGGELVLAKLRSEDPVGSHAAQRLLVQLSGRDFGRDVGAWERWISSL